MKLITLLAAALISFVSLKASASPFADLANEKDAEWIIGTWTAAEGKFKVTYEWRLEKHAIAVKFEGGGRSSEGMMALKPGTKEVHYMGVDSLGAISLGQWVESNGHPALKTTRVDSNGETKVIAEHIKVDEKTFKTRLLKQNDAGEAGELIGELEFKKQ